MAFCTNCGAQVSSGTKFCPNCGQKVESKEQTAAPVQKAPAEPVAQPQTPVQGAYTASYTAPAQQSYTPPVQPPKQASYTAPAQQSYTPPVQPPKQASYTAPAQQSYTPPVQQPKQASYTAPAQQSYIPPVQPSYQPQSGQQNYSAQNTYAPPAYAAAPKQKKPLNKKMLFIAGGAALALILIIVLIASLGGKNDTKEAVDPNLGLYTATSAEMMGVTIDVASMFEQGVTIELKEKGKCAMNIDGTKGNGKWTLEDGVFHIEGGGFDCDGTLKSGKLTLENVLDMGINLLLEKERGNRSDDTGDGATAALPDSSAADTEATALQKQWNGTWYGCMYVKEATGEFSDVSSGSDGYYDVYMVVDVDGDGKGQFAVFLANVDEAFATANCEAKESGLYAIDGKIVDEVEMYAYNWMFLPMPDYPDQYAMNDIIEDGDSVFEYTLFMKQWGGSWQDEIDSDFNIVPPSVESYHIAIENGELPPIGFAPVDYAVSASSNAQQPASTDASAATGDSTSAPATLHEGEPSSTGDGMLKSLDDLYRLAKWMWNMEYSYQRTYATYDLVANYCGVQGLDDGNEGPNSVSEQGDHYFFWKYDNTRYVYAGFRPNEAGDWVLANMNTSGFQIADIPESITVSYETASALGVGRSEFAGKLSASIEDFMTSIMTPVTLTVPDAGWCYRLDKREIRVYNVASLEAQNSGSPIIKIKTQETLDDVNFYYNDFANAKEIEDRTIGGVDMKGRTYDHVGMSWTEYYGEMPSGIWMTIAISRIDLATGSEGDAILNSIAFK